MTFEQTQNVERSIQPQGGELAHLSVCNSEMAIFQTRHKPGSSTSILNKELELFGNGFSFDEVANPYGDCDTIAWGPREDYQKLQNNARGTDIVRQISPPDIASRAEQTLFPLRGQEDQQLAQATKKDAHAWEHALLAIPELAGTGVTPDVLKALVKNEMHWYVWPKRMKPTTRHIRRSSQ